MRDWFEDLVLWVIVEEAWEKDVIAAELMWVACAMYLFWRKLAGVRVMYGKTCGSTVREDLSYGRAISSLLIREADLPPLPILPRDLYIWITYKAIITY